MKNYTPYVVIYCACLGIMNSAKLIDVDVGFYLIHNC
jgi:hypothetical protein